jgi:cytochrome P450
MAETAEAQALVYNPYSYEIHEDPYPVYERLRAEAPVYRNEEVGIWALSRHADVLAGFRDTVRMSNWLGVSIEPSASVPEAARTTSFLGMDPPRHDQIRALVSRAFTPRRVSALEARMRELTVSCLESFEGEGRCDFIADFAGILPMAVISELMGVPEADRDWLRERADTVLHREPDMLDVPPAGAQASFDIFAYFARFIEERRKQPADDLTGALMEAEIEGKRLCDEEVTGFLFLMIIAGNETTTKMLGNALYWLWRNPNQRDLVAADPSLISRWVEETLRYDNSTQALKRTLTTDLDLHGVRMHDGDKVMLLIGSANRDEEVFPQADRFDIMRDTTSMLSFGHGTHFCLGASLARLEGRVVLEEMWPRMPDFEVLPDGIERVHSVNVRGFARLPVEFRTR